MILFLTLYRILIWIFYKIYSDDVIFFLFISIEKCSQQNFPFFIYPLKIGSKQLSHFFFCCFFHILYLSYIILYVHIAEMILLHFLHIQFLYCLAICFFLHIYKALRIKLQAYTNSVFTHI